MGLNLEFMLSIIPELLSAMVITLQISILAVLLGIMGGLVVGSFRVIGPKWLKMLIQLLVDYIRGTPQIVHILIIYFALPRIGIILNAYWTGVVALTIIATGYEVEIVRTAIESIDKGQIEAGLAIGLLKRQILIFVLLPQAIRRIIPPLTNELTNIVKASAFLSVIAVNELTKISNKIIYETFYFFEVLILTALIYTVIITLLGMLSNFIEKRMFSTNSEANS